MKRWRVCILALACFGAGALSATVYEGIAQGARQSHRGALFRGLADKLGLTDTQETRLDEIVDKARHRMVNLSHETKPRFRAIKQETRDKIREILDVEQLATFNAICDSCDRDRRRGSR